MDRPLPVARTRFPAVPVAELPVRTVMVPVAVEALAAESAVRMDTSPERLGLEAADVAPDTMVTPPPTAPVDAPPATVTLPPTPALAAPPVTVTAPPGIVPVAPVDCPAVI